MSIIDSNQGREEQEVHHTRMAIEGSSTTKDKYQSTMLYSRASKKGGVQKRRRPRFASRR